MLRLWTQIFSTTNYSGNWWSISVNHFSILRLTKQWYPSSLARSNPIPSFSWEYYEILLLRFHYTYYLSWQTTLKWKHHLTILLTYRFSLIPTIEHHNKNQLVKWIGWFHPRWRHHLFDEVIIYKWRNFYYYANIHKWCHNFLVFNYLN